MDMESTPSGVELAQNKWEIERVHCDALPYGAFFFGSGRRKQCCRTTDNFICTMYIRRESIEKVVPKERMSPAFGISPVCLT